MIWTDAYLAPVIEQAEKDISREVKCIVSRFSLAISAGTAIYDLPTGIIGILRVTWKGKRLDAEFPKEWENTSSYRPNSTGTEGVPHLYFAERYGYNKIEFLPNPNETIAADDSGIYGTDIANRVIVTAYFEADPNDAEKRLPAWNRRNLLKYYTLEKAFLKEGQGQNLEASQYFGNKYKLHIEWFKELVQNIYRAKENTLSPSLGSSQCKGKPARPSLPSGSKWSF